MADSTATHYKGALCL